MSSNRSDDGWGWYYWMVGTAIYDLRFPPDFRFSRMEGATE